MGEPSLELWAIGGCDESSHRGNSRRRWLIVLVPLLMEPSRSHSDVLRADGFVFGLRAGPTSRGSNDMLRVGPVFSASRHVWDLRSGLEMAWPSRIPQRKESSRWKKVSLSRKSPFLPSLTVGQ